MKDAKQIHVLMPDDNLITVDYYCENGSKNRGKATLVIQLDDCVCKLEIEKSICKDDSQLERLVHNKVINTKGHLC